MPLFAERGPLTLDPEIEKLAVANLEQETCEMRINIESLTPPLEHISLPCEGILVFNKKERELSILVVREYSKERICTSKYSESYPTIELDILNTTAFDITMSADVTIKCTTDSITTRDIIAITIRFAGRVGFDIETLGEAIIEEVTFVF